MVTKAQKVRLGFFFFISVGLLILFILIMVGERLMERLDTYYIAYEDVSVSGLQIGAQVKYHGIRVGRVENIKFDPIDVNKVIVEVKIEKGTPIKADTEATLILVGITGLKQVELFGGTKEAPLLKPNSFIVAGKTFFDDISVSVEEITTKLDRVLGNIDTLTNYETQHKIANLLSNLEQVGLTSLNTVSKIESLVDSPELNTIVGNTVKFSEDVAKMDISSTVEQLNSAVNQANQTFIHLDLMIIRSRQDILLSLEKMRETMDNLEEFSRQLSENPSSIIR